MTIQQTKELQKLHNRGCTDSDIEVFCDTYHVRQKEAFHQIAEWSVPVCCKGCKNVEMFSSMPPCTSCCRSKEDLYEES